MSASHNKSSITLFEYRYIIEFNQFECSCIRRGFDSTLPMKTEHAVDDRKRRKKKDSLA